MNGQFGRAVSWQTPPPPADARGTVSASTDSQDVLEDAVARFILDFEWADIADESFPAIKALLKDQLALQFAARNLPWSRAVRSFLRNGRSGRSSVIAEHGLLDAADAAYINATYGHGFEYDDVAANGHPGSCVVPAAIAVGEEVGASLGEVIEAIVAGYEVYVRIGLLAAPYLVTSGWHAHSVLANFGSAAVAARLYGLNLSQTRNALAIALSHASGTGEYVASGGSIKRVHAGIAVRNGIEAANLARAGLTGPRLFLTGQRGLFLTFIRRPALPADTGAAFTDRRQQHIKDAWLKAYCCCGAYHPYIEAMASLQSRAAEIRSVDVKLQATTRALAGNQSAQHNDSSSLDKLQFALDLQMGMAVLGKGNGYATHMAFLEGRLDVGENSDIAEFARRLRFCHAPRLDQDYPASFVGELDVHWHDDTTKHIFVDGAKGMPSHPLSSEEHRSKLNELVHDVSHAEELFSAIDELDPRLPVSSFATLLRST